ncbi:1-(5-phosphoribosyl)-5-amino-4-imidazole-carboxylate carboxylase [Anaerosporomusa subterranea]|uniref:1-(5-phosphoribosyl)-5-amino-4-imidazole-carboxylate carboxylase n=1 Tax=Anaerosporomusa subterranea TaxID=1794912 RepID=A0A154BT26_ANASB|nr:nickel pincer cofactor biosynthesis protein LarB [Anaerosporomusa subterranea]KYZ77082.1 1-(5-phosphoribosyl)-5-amino-4-imidazole-carboxylate carboxylase [Anaerosporomusa subterranea]
MDDKQLIELLESYRSGQISTEEGVAALRTLPYEDLGFAKIDHHRTIRQGFPEVIFCQGKTVEQVATIATRLAGHNNNLLATRATHEMFEAVKLSVPDAVYREQSRLITVKRDETVVDPDRFILVVTAGTGDIPVAEEAAITAEMMGNTVKTVYDVGVAGIHRLIAQYDLLQQANVLIVVAGMEGALASVVGGMVAKPVIAVPTSVGYGANFGGLSALLAMLNSCAAGIGVVNIDNGFGAGRLASMINQMR